MAERSQFDTDLSRRVAELSQGQKDCLELVSDHATSKEIALQLGISRHTVDARMRSAMATLGVSSRREAAMLYRTSLGEAISEAQIAAYVEPGGPMDLAGQSSFRLWGGRNRMSPGARVVAVILVCILAIMAFGVLVSSMAALSDLRAG